jgi:hypothetical protein
MIEASSSMNRPFTICAATSLIGMAGLLGSCGGTQRAPTNPVPSASNEAPGTAPGAPSASAAPEPVASAPAAAPVASAAQPAANPAWKDMSPEQRKEFMKSTVLPKMHDAFVTYNAKAYDKMNCATRHGASAKDATFKMPNPQLPKLPSDEAGFKALAKKKPDAAKFMGEVVVPKWLSS